MGNLLGKIKLGKTELMVSKLCFGTLAIGPYHSNLSPADGGNLLAVAYRNGINFWDTAHLYETYPHIRQAMEILHYPEDLIISSRSFARDYDEMKEHIHYCLDSLKLNSIHIFGIHELSPGEDYQNSTGAFRALEEAKKSGLIKYVAVSMHSVKSLELVNELSSVDIVFPLYNKKGIAIKDGTAEEMASAITKANRSGKGVYAMKVLAGGHLASNPEEYIKFVLYNTDINSIAIGMDNEDELSYNIALFNEDETSLEVYRNKLKLKKRIIHIDPWCEGCGECIKICPNSALKLEFSQAKIIPDRCVLCGYCASACKYFCIKVVNVT